ncbi:MAG: phosphatidate cytidylyltransferase [Gemmatimonadota bacterium]|nr:phosphatidate cytidylyltransferase [Gemmatimonadota bacterium]
MSEFAKRVAVAAVAIPAVIAIIWAGGPWLAGFLAVVAGLASWEFYRLAIGTGSEPLWGHGVLFSALVPVAVAARYAGLWVPPVSLVMIVVLELLTVALWVRGASGKPLEVVGITLLGTFYTGGMLAFGYALRYHRFAIDAQTGALLTALPVVLTWATDTGAMLIGRALGKTRLMPSISPAKTVAGAWGGALVAVLMAVAYVAFGLRPYAHLTMSLPAAAAFGFVVSAAGQVGDLVESMLKRQANVKDSSTLIPGHGGVLDRVDSLLFTLPAAYVLYDFLLASTP